MTAFDSDAATCSDGGERAEKLANDVISTNKLVGSALEQLETEQEGGQFIENALVLPLAAQYRALLEPLRFDYMSMRDAKASAGSPADFVHHYKALAS